MICRKSFSRSMGIKCSYFASSQKSTPQGVWSTNVSTYRKVSEWTVRHAMHAANDHGRERLSDSVSRMSTASLIDILSKKGKLRRWVNVRDPTRHLPRSWNSRTPSPAFAVRTRRFELRCSAGYYPSRFGSRYLWKVHCVNWWFLEHIELCNAEHSDTHQYNWYHHKILSRS